MTYLVWEHTVTYYGKSLRGFEPSSIFFTNIAILDMPPHLTASSWAIDIIPFFSVPSVVQCACYLYIHNGVEVALLNLLPIAFQGSSPGGLSRSFSIIISP
jgi:hypothetical protein